MRIFNLKRTKNDSKCAVVFVKPDNYASLAFSMFSKISCNALLLLV